MSHATTVFTDEPQNTPEDRGGSGILKMLQFPSPATAAVDMPSRQLSLTGGVLSPALASSLCPCFPPTCVFREQSSCKARQQVQTASSTTARFPTVPESKAHILGIFTFKEVAGKEKGEVRWDWQVKHSCI